LALSLPGAGFGDSMRCQNSGGSSLVSTGDSKFRVLEACGEPAGREVVSTVTQGVRQGPYFQQMTITIERWYYFCGYGQFDKTLQFQGDQLVAVLSGKKSHQEGPPRCF
ncbi:MAG: DUF2845 domain-containing protein, partial [Magnetococcales bacterium]|nr:DUF2845 domain-containing protein [Magnetococcales bacterium]